MSYLNKLDKALSAIDLVEEPNRDFSVDLLLSIVKAIGYYKLLRLRQSPSTKTFFGDKLVIKVLERAYREALFIRNKLYSTSSDIPRPISFTKSGSVIYNSREKKSNGTEKVSKIKPRVIRRKVK